VDVDCQILLGKKIDLRIWKFLKKRTPIMSKEKPESKQDTWEICKLI
jgi:hypothetical protein